MARRSQMRMEAQWPSSPNTLSRMMANEGKIQARYGYAKDKVKQEVDDWLSKS
jgi:hypothetical protein